MKKLLVLIVCAVMLCACGGSKPQSKEESKTLPASSVVLKGKHAKLFKVAGNSYTILKKIASVFYTHLSRLNSAQINRPIINISRLIVTNP